jgi:hypothetical protein
MAKTTEQKIIYTMRSRSGFCGVLVIFSFLYGVDDFLFCCFSHYIVSLITTYDLEEHLSRYKRDNVMAKTTEQTIIYTIQKAKDNKNSTKTRVLV